MGVVVAQLCYGSCAAAIRSLRGQDHSAAAGAAPMCRRPKRSVDHARASRSRNRPPRPGARHGGRALRRGRGAPPRRSALSVAEGLRAAADRQDGRAGSAAAPNICSPICRRATCWSCISACRARFRVGNDARSPASSTITSAPRAPRTTTWCFACRTAATVTYNDPRRFGFMELVRAPSSTSSRCFAGSGTEPLGNEFDAGHAGDGCAAKARARSRPRCSTSASSPGSATSMSARRCSGALLVAEAQASTIADRTARRTIAPCAGRRHQGGAARRRSRPAARPCATIATPTARSAISSTASGSMTARASRARRPAATARSSASCRPAARRSICPVCQK